MIYILSKYHTVLWVILVPNKKYVSQKWRVQFGNIKNSFVSKSELLAKLPDSFLIVDYLPKRTRFYDNLQELLFDEEYTIEVSISCLHFLFINYAEWDFCIYLVYILYFYIIFR